MRDWDWPVCLGLLVVAGVVSVALVQRLKRWRAALTLARFDYVQWAASVRVLPTTDGARQSEAPLIPAALGSVLAELESDWQLAQSDRARAAACNEATNEFERKVGVARADHVAWRIVAASAVAVACLLASTHPFAAACSIGCGVVGGGLTWQLGRAADLQTRTARRRWNGLIRRLSRSFHQR